MAQSQIKCHCYFSQFHNAFSPYESRFEKTCLNIQSQIRPDKKTSKCGSWQLVLFLLLFFFDAQSGPKGHIENKGWRHREKQRPGQFICRETKQRVKVHSSLEVFAISRKTGLFCFLSLPNSLSDQRMQDIFSFFCQTNWKCKQKTVQFLVIAWQL